MVDKIIKILEKDKIANLNILGRIKFEESYFFEYTPKGTGIIYKSDFWHAIYCQDDSEAKELLSKIKTDNEIGFCGVGERYYYLTKEIHTIKWEEFCHLYYLEKENLNLNLLSHNVDNLKLEDAPLVNEYYTYKEEGSLKYIEDCIQNRPTSVIRDEMGFPISWAVIREDGSLGIMYTLKEHRGKGYAVSVSIDLAKKAFDMGLIPYIHIVVGNTPSIKLAESIGFKYHSDIVWFGI